MRIKRFRGKSVNNLLRRIRRDLGPDVQLLETRNVRPSGLFGFLQPREIEIAVAFEREPDTGRKRAAVRADAAGDQDLDADRKNRDKDGRNHRDDEADEANRTGSVAGETEPAATRAEARILLERGVPQETADLLASRLNNGRRLEEFSWMRSVPISAPGEGRGKVVALVGPTGAGKTTTCAKLAAHMSLSRGYQVGLITSDTYRIGAVEQLRKYARILQCEFEVVFAPEEMRGALRRLASADIVFVDTAGHNPRDAGRLQRLSKFLQSAGPDEIHLVMDAGVDADEGIDVLDRYRGIGFNRLLVTKLDETGRPGKILSLVEAAGVPLSYICDGQEVPDDVGLASDILSATLLEGIV